MLRVIHITNPTDQPKAKKVNHRTKAYTDNLKREILLDHNRKFRNQNRLS